MKNNSPGNPIIRSGVYLADLSKNDAKFKLWIEDFIEYQFIKLLYNLK